MQSLTLLHFILYFLAAVIFTGLITPFAIKIAFRLRILDEPNGRKVHKYSKPRVGGLAMFSIYLLLLLTLDLSNNLNKVIIIGSILITFFGFLDDLLNIRASGKLLFQVLVAYLTASSFFGFGIRIEELKLLSDVSIHLGLLSVPFTIVWIVGVMNAINLIDGLDGLAGGICAIAAFTMGLAALFFGQREAALLFFILLGVILGFLRYNFNPARLFMGDSGSVFLGYNIAVLSIVCIWNSPRVIAFTIPFLVLGIPFYDVITSILRRLKNKQPIFSPDGNHIHHRIMNIGFTHKQTVIVIYMESLFLAVASSSIMLINNNSAVIVFIAICFLINFSGRYLKKTYKDK